VWSSERSVWGDLSVCVVCVLCVCVCVCVVCVCVCSDYPTSPDNPLPACYVINSHDLLQRQTSNYTSAQRLHTHTHTHSHTHTHTCTHTHTHTDRERGEGDVEV